MRMLPIPDPFYVAYISLENFIRGMVDLGIPIECALVGVFEKEGRGSRRDLNLPFHRDGIYSKSLEETQGGVIVTHPNICFVGLYCIRRGKEPCFTTLSLDGEREYHRVDLKRGDSLILDNRRIWHGREGSVGDRLLMRVWCEERQ